MNRIRDWSWDKSKTPIIQDAPDNSWRLATLYPDDSVLCYKINVCRTFFLDPLKNTCCTTFKPDSKTFSRHGDERDTLGSRYMGQTHYQMIQLCYNRNWQYWCNTLAFFSKRLGDDILIVELLSSLIFPDASSTILLFKARLRLQELKINGFWSRTASNTHGETTQRLSFL